jgi:hypothetical protein
MEVRELCGGLHGYMTFVVKNETDLYRGKFADMEKFSELMWNEPPELILKSSPHNQKKHKGKPLRVPDIGHLTPGSVIINKKAVKALGEHFTNFGHLVQLEVEGETWYSYVVTNVLEGVVDMENSIVSRSGTMKRPAFFANKLPNESQIFKTPETGLMQIFFNDNGEGTLQTLLQENDIDAGKLKEVWEQQGINGKS